MKQIENKKKPCFSQFLALGAGMLLILISCTGWWLCQRESDSSSLDSAIFVADNVRSFDAEHVIYPDFSSEGGERASLGINLGWLKDQWRSEPVSFFDNSLKKFIAEKEKVCIPRYTDPVPWEEDARYTVQETGCGTQIFRTKIRSGDSIGSLLRIWLDRDEQQEAVKAVSAVFKISRLRPGRPFSVERNTEDGKISRFMYDVDEESRLVLCRTQEGFTASVNVYQYETSLVRVSGEVKTSLFDAMTDAGESSSLAVQLADVFSHQVDFINEVQEGDSFDVVVEKRYLEGSFRAYGDIVAARFSNDGIVYEAFRFFDDEGVPHYYAADGSSLETQFLKAPLNFTRISSGFTLKRRHPVFGRVRPHQGIDYAAPRGTPVKALGDGVVTFIGWKKGYGKSVAIQHCGGVETHYAHLSRYAKNLSKGSRVEQGQLIAYVGTTGTATGPHLDFRVKKNGVFIDPLKLTGGRNAAVPFEQRLLFEKQVHQARLLLDGEAILAVK